VEEGGAGKFERRRERKEVIVGTYVFIVFIGGKGDPKRP
jgi:hypothetical protein